MAGTELVRRPPALPARRPASRPDLQALDQRRALERRRRQLAARRTSIRRRSPRSRGGKLTPNQLVGLVVGGVLLLLAAPRPAEASGPAPTATTPPVAAPSATAPASVADIPAEYLALYRQSGGICPGLDWALLAGVGKIETDHGRARLPGVRSGTNYAGAAGPMQFLFPTFGEVRGKYRDVGPDIYAPEHAIPAAAHYLCDGGLAAGRGVRAALWIYNHSSSYADAVLAAAARYRAASGG
jgi:hypothetical protein